jgi:hypothetical protein
MVVPPHCPRNAPLQVKPPYQGWIVGVANQHIILAEVDRERAAEVRADEGLLTRAVQIEPLDGVLISA